MDFVTVLYKKTLRKRIVLSNVFLIIKFISINCNKLKPLPIGCGFLIFYIYYVYSKS